MKKINLITSAMAVILVIMTIAVLFFGCNHPHKYYKVHEYKVVDSVKTNLDSGNTTAQVHNSNDVVFLYWYVMMITSNNQTTYYSYSSSTRLTEDQLEKVDYSANTEMPFEKTDVVSESTQQIDVEGVSDADFKSYLEESINDNPEEVAEPAESNTSDGNVNSAEEENSSSSTDEPTSSESGDSGSSGDGSGSSDGGGSGD